MTFDKTSTAKSVRTCSTCVYRALAGANWYACGLKESPKYNRGSIDLGADTCRHHFTGWPRTDWYLIDKAIKHKMRLLIETDGEAVWTKDTAVEQSDIAGIMMILNDTDEATLVFSDANINHRGKAYILYEFGQAPYEIVYDYTASGWVADMMQEYFDRNR